MHISESVGDLIIRQARESDLTALVALSRKTFTDKFGHLYATGDLEDFLNEFHCEDFYSKSLSDQSGLLEVVETGNGSLGAYLMCGQLSLPAQSPQNGAVELKRLYVDTPFQGRGLGSVLVRRALSWAQSRHAPEIYLSVFSENHGARRLYERHGWHKAGEFIFLVGQHEDLEFLMRRAL